MNNKAFERPLDGPAEDLLGAAGHARRLAAMLKDIELPLTVGIYGSWGAGKTSFANILAAELAAVQGWESAELIRFSAWPYTTADTIWQALVELVARTLCKHDSDDDRTDRVRDVQPDWRAKVRAVLLSRAFTLRAPKTDPNRELYDQLVRRLNTATGMASRSASERVGGLTLGRALALVLESAGAMTPTVNPLKRLLSGDGTAGGLFAAESPAPTLVQTIEDVRADLQAVFERAKSKRLIVLIDDLDRCLPEVALDVLETVKIFFFESQKARANCLFLVAADHQLIARGLRARLGESGTSTNGAEARAYLEKIVQLGISLPEIRQAEAHRLVAAWSPEWSQSSDLLIQALDGNPRRMKQQTALLSYRYEAAAQGHASDQELAVHAKAVRLAALDPEVLSEILTVRARDEDGSFLLAHERMVREPQAGDPRSGLTDALRRNPNLLDAFVQGPTLRNVPPADLGLLFSLVDATPDSGGGVEIRDRVFNFVVRMVLKQKGATTEQTLAYIFLRRVLELRNLSPGLIAQLAELSRDDNDSYVELVSSFDDLLDVPPVGVDKAALGPPLQRLLDAVQPLLERRDSADLLIASPRLSELPPEYVRFVEQMGGVQQPGKTQPPDVRGPLSAALAIFQSAVADTLLPVVARTVKESAAELTAPVRLRLGLAHDLVERRKYAKLQLLLFRWPQIASVSHARTFATWLRDLEAVMVRRDAEVKDLAVWDSLVKDERLRDFLSLPPSFGQLFYDDVAKLKPLHDEVPSLMGAYQPDAMLPADDGSIEVYANVTLTLEVKGVDQGELVVEVHVADQRTSESETAQTRIRASELTVAAAHIGVASAGPSATTLTRAVRPLAPLGTPTQVLEDVGRRLWQDVIGCDEKIASVLKRALARPERVRLYIRTRSAAPALELQLARLPWECMYLPDHRVFAGRTLKVSVVREIGDPANLVHPRIPLTVRILAVAVSPVDYELPGTAEETGLLRKLIETQPVADLRILANPTKDELRRELQAFSPHVFHFMGHAIVREGEGALVLVDNEGKPDLLSAKTFGDLAQDYGILLAVLNGCATGSAEIKSVADGVAQILVMQGVPAAVATSRPIADDAAMNFAAEFYRVFLDGASLEVALVEARKALSLNGWDWSAYVLYASRRLHLDEIRIRVQHSARQVGR